jgi:hypothetical protein
MDLNFFQWFRSAIRQTVLLGVSDAMQALGSPEKLGSPDRPDEVHPQLAALLSKDMLSKDSASSAATEKSEPAKVGTKPNQRRLGKSLKELNPQIEK